MLYRTCTYFLCNKSYQKKITILQWSFLYTKAAMCAASLELFASTLPSVSVCDRLRLKCDGTRAETRFRLSAKRTSPFKSAGASVRSTTGSRGVRISGSNAGCTMFRGSVKSTGYPLHSPVSPFTSPPVRRHRAPSHFNWSLPLAACA
jgi:hypothetical protein